MTAELTLALPTVALIIAITLGAFSLQLEKLKLISIAGSVARGIARGESEADMRRLADSLRSGTSIELKFQPAVICAKAFFEVRLQALGGQKLVVADWQCARNSGL